MGKLKTRKTLLKRFRVTKTGKLVHGQINTGHLKVKWSTSKRFRKLRKVSVGNKGHIKKLRKMLGNHA